MAKAMTVAEAKAHFSECIKSAEDGEIVVITRYGKAAAAVVSAKYLSELEDKGKLDAGRRGLAALVGRFNDGDDFTTQIEAVVRNRAASRKTPTLG
ncbi:MAG: type II toxin-antitoxin system prevent-host-death family antitoxin [Polyangiaceae bacterium]|nr:type II toxin-antitoxin system prevent-host-death family antitoxin [Polyangiaceae bacterium]